MSMGLSDMLDLARADLIASLRRLPPGTLFQVIPYNHTTEPLRLGGTTGLVPADPPVIEEAVTRLAALTATGPTKHLQALKRGLALRPEVIFLATDADDLTDADVRAVTALNQGRAAIHVIDLARGQPRPDSPLARLAANNRGQYRRVDSR
jgi:hypothetical protein